MAARLDVLGRLIEAELELVIETPIELELSTVEMGAIHELEVLGDYVLVKHLARGAMCDVWLALQMFLGELVRPVIIKRVDPLLARDPEFRRRFLRQAAIADRMRSPNIAPVFELGTDAQSFFLATAYVQGASVAELLASAVQQKSPIPEGIAARIASEILGGLHAIHSMTNNKGRSIGAAHHDLSPQSVLIDFEGRVQLSDTGIGKAAEGFSREQRWFSPYKARYKSPEQTRGERGTARSDQYSIGVLLFEMVTGSVSPVAASEEERRDILDALAPALEKNLRSIILCASSIDPAERFRSALDLRHVLDGTIRQLNKRVPDSDRLDLYMQHRFKKRMTELRIMLGQASDKAAAALQLSQRRADKRPLDSADFGSVLEESGPAWSYS